jgi:uncharacterized cupredoxin-like copper-binding protein
MKTSLAAVVLALPTLVMASGTQNGNHPMAEGNSMPMGHAMQGQPITSMSGAMGTTGRPGDPAKVDRTIEITMDDTMRFTPSTIQVDAGETVRFFIKNTGKLTHEMVLGSLDELKEHAEQMRNMPGMAHTMANMITLKAGQRGGLVWSFDQPGTVDFACLVPGHMQAGMKGSVQVN